MTIEKEIVVKDHERPLGLNRDDTLRSCEERWCLQSVGRRDKTDIQENNLVALFSIAVGAVGQERVWVFWGTDVVQRRLAES